MLPWYWLVGGAALAGGAFWLSRPSPEPVADSGDGSTGSDVVYSSALGMLPAGSINAMTGQTTTGTGLDALLAGLSSSSASDTTLGLAGMEVDKTLGLAQIASNEKVQLATADYTYKTVVDTNKTQLNMVNSNNQYALMTNTLQNAKALSEAGVSSIGGGFTYDENGGMHMQSGLLYTDPAKNLAYATGTDASGNLIGLDPSGTGRILALSAQTKYDMTTYTDADGKTQSGVLTWLGNVFDRQNPAPSTTPTTTPTTGGGGGGGGTGNPNPNPKPDPKPIKRYKPAGAWSKEQRQGARKNLQVFGIKGSDKTTKKGDGNQTNLQWMLRKMFGDPKKAAA